MTTTPTTANTPIDQYMGQQVNNPTLTDSTTLTPTLQTATPDTTLQNTGQYNIGNNQAQGGGAVTAQTVDPNQVPTVNAQNSQYTAAQSGAAQGTAAQGQVHPLDTVQGQLSSLYSQFQAGNVPAWAIGAVTAANQASASRGLGMSTIGTTAIAQAIQQQAINIAAPDAATYFAMDMQNLNNQQQTGMQNVQTMQQSLLSNQASLNAAAQFNATSQAQVDEFNSNLISTIQGQNADRVNAVSQFNSNQTQALNTFNSQLAFQTQQFNAQNAFAIDQSNVLWQRSVNTANTAATNAANQVNVQNAFNLSSTALNNLWQEFRDNAAFSFTASQNQAMFNANNAMVANNESFISNIISGANSQSTLQSIGGFAASLLGTLFTGSSSPNYTTNATQARS